MRANHPVSIGCFSFSDWSSDSSVARFIRNAEQEYSLNKNHRHRFSAVRYLCVPLLALGVAGGVGQSAAAAELNNREAVIPPQCYTRTEGKHNPCYICHQSHPDGSRINVMDDGDIQGEYSFSAIGETNQWLNLFKPRQEAIQSVSDASILDYVKNDNYSVLMTQDSAGYTPDLEQYADPDQAFDTQGFSRDGSGWVAFNYKPLPSTFWPTNGSFDDVVIRLPVEFRQLNDQTENRSAYLLNLSLVEMAIKDLDQISIPETDEALFAVDLDGNGIVSTTTVMQRRERYLGAAGHIEVLRQQYPVGTEFLHSVRYLDVSESGDVVAAPRFKELRYARKIKAHTEQALAFLYNQEHREKEEERLPTYSWAKPAGEAGLNNKMGWIVQGWIEDEAGALRRQSYEENFYCMGCHTSIGTTIDQTFAFPRKITGADGWGYLNLKGMKDVSSRGEQEGEILTYFRRVGGGDEFRQNQEILERWFDDNGSVDAEKVKAADVYQLLAPTPERALALNKAYQQVVLEQSFYLGRDAVLGDPVNVYEHVQQDQAPVLSATRQFHYDIRLDWSGFTVPPVSTLAVAEKTATDSSGNNSDTASGGSFNWLYSVILLAMWQLIYWVSSRSSGRRFATPLLDKKTTSIQELRNNS